METIMRMNLDIDYWKAKRTNLWSIPDRTLSILHTLLSILYIFSVFQAKENKIVFTTLDKKNFFFKGMGPI